MTTTDSSSADLYGRLRLRFEHHLIEAIMLNTKPILTLKLSPHYTVFQAELLAIYKTTRETEGKFCAFKKKVLAFVPNHRSLHTHRQLGIRRCNEDKLECIIRE